MQNKISPLYLKGTRDLRIDFIRGFVMLMVITIHMENYSLFTAIFYGRLGFISSAEGFVIMSGIVVGIVYSKKCKKLGLWCASQKLLKRAVQLYAVNVCVSLLIALITKLNLIDTYFVTHWINPVTQHATSTYHTLDGGLLETLKTSFLLQQGPHQIQVLGLYVFLLVLAPVALWLINSGKSWLLLLISWVVYFINYFLQIRITGAGFEYAFPALTWQLLFYNCMVIGANLDTLQEQCSKHKSAYKIIIWSCLILWLGFIFFSLNRPSPVFWPGQTFSFIDAETFQSIYFNWFYKDKLQIGRVVNNIVVYIVVFAVLSRYWSGAKKYLGWLLIPIGQASLYVFIVHVFIILLASNFVPHFSGEFWSNTLLQSGVILLIWWMVKRGVLFSIIIR